MAHQAPLKYIFYIAATPEKVWEGFVSRESNRIIFSGAELQSDFIIELVFGKPRGKTCLEAEPGRRCAPSRQNTEALRWWAHWTFIVMRIHG